MLEPLSANDVYAVAIPIVLILIGLEAFIGLISGKRLYRTGDTFGTLGMLAGNILVQLGIKGSLLLFHLWLYDFRIIDLKPMMPLWAFWLLTLVAIDFIFYWYHRASHRSRFLWAIHMNHHSSEEMNFVVAFRQAWLGPVSKIPFFFILPLLGFDPTITVVVGVFNTLWGVWGHTQIIGWLGTPIEYIFNTPSAHRVHHGSNPEYIDKNYGNFFIIWDRLFGTYERERAPVIYGITENVNTYNPVKITLMYWQTIGQDLGAASGWREKLFCIFAPPEWQPRAKDSAYPTRDTD